MPPKKHEGIDLYLGVGQEAYDIYVNVWSIEDWKAEVKGNIYFPLYIVE